MDDYLKGANDERQRVLEYLNIACHSASDDSKWALNGLRFQIARRGRMEKPTLLSKPLKNYDPDPKTNG